MQKKEMTFSRYIDIVNREKPSCGFDHCEQPYHYVDVKFGRPLIDLLERLADELEKTRPISPVAYEARQVVKELRPA